MASPSGDESAAARNLGGIANYNADSTREQLDLTLSAFDQADTQNRALADTQIEQHQKTAAADRFAQAKKLQMSTSSVRDAAGNALQGSGLGALIDMLRSRTDLDTQESISTLKQNKNSVWNALQEALNANVNARNDAANQAEAAIRAIEADMAAQLNNINPSLYRAPGTGSTALGSTNMATDRFARATAPATSGYYTHPADAGYTRPQSGSGYFDALLNSYR